MPNAKTKIEKYMEQPAFNRHRQTVIAMYDRNKKYIDDVCQDFFIYYFLKPDKEPNIRKLYNIMLRKLGYEKRFLLFDPNELFEKMEKIYDDNIIS